MEKDSIDKKLTPTKTTGKEKDKENIIGKQQTHCKAQHIQ